MSSSIVAPKIILASGSAACEIISAASFTSVMDKFGPPIMLNKIPLAPSKLTSNNGLLIALRAAVTARPSPEPIPIPISAVPASVIIVLTSAKSTFINPGVVIKSLILCTPCPKIESAIRNASSSVIFLSTTSSNL